MRAGVPWQPLTRYNCEPHDLVSVAYPDRTWKLERYLALERLRECWILESDVARLQQYVRAEDEWMVRAFNGSEAELRCEAFELRVPLDVLYRLVFEQDAV